MINDFYLYIDPVKPSDKFGVIVHYVQNGVQKTNSVNNQGNDVTLFEDGLYKYDFADVKMDMNSSYWLEFIDKGTGKIYQTNKYVKNSICLSRFSSDYANGDFSKSGNVVKINGSDYLLLSVNGTHVKVLGKTLETMKYYDNEEEGLKYPNGMKRFVLYSGSKPDLYLNNYYEELPEVVKNAIIPQSIYQSVVKLPKSNTEIEVTYKEFAGTRKIYLPDLSDFSEIIGSIFTIEKASEYNEFLHLRFGTRTAIEGYIDLVGFTFWGVESTNPLFNYRNTQTHSVKPVFVIDLQRLT